MSNHQHTDNPGGRPLGEPQHAMLEDVLDIAERALWKPAKVSHDDIQKLAAVVIAYVRRMRGDDDRSSGQEPDGFW